MTYEAEVLADLHRENEKLLGAHPDAEMIDLMDAAAAVGALHGAGLMLATFNAQLAMMEAARRQ